MSENVHRDRLFGALLMAVGGLIAGLCGLCSLTTFLGMFASTIMAMTSGYGGGAGVLFGIVWGLLLVGVVGGLPTFLGVMMFRAGLNMRRRSQVRPIASVFGDDPDRRP